MCLQSSKLITSWLKERIKKGLDDIEVPYIRLNDTVRVCLRDDYGFNCNSNDMRYLETCNNTTFKKFITENVRHFFRYHTTRSRQSMPQYLVLLS